MNGTKPGAVPRTPGWFPRHPGERLRGRITGFSEGTTPYGPRRIVEVETEEGERRALWLSSKVLSSKFEAAAPPLGAWLQVTYQGLHPKNYHLFDLEVSGAAPAPKTSRRKKPRSRSLGTPSNSRKAPRLPGLQITEKPISVTTRSTLPPDPNDPFDGI